MNIKLWELRKEDHKSITDYNDLFIKFCKDDKKIKTEIHLTV